MSVAIVVEFINLFFIGILTGLEIAVHYGFHTSTAALDEKPQLILRQGVVRRLRWLVPAFFLPAAFSGIAVMMIDGDKPGLLLRLAAMGFLIIWIFVRYPLIEWNMADYRAKHRAWELKISTSVGTQLQKLRKNEPKLKKVGSGCAGLWRKGMKTRPAMMTDYILSEKLLPEDEVRCLQEQAPQEILQNQQAFAAGADILNWHDFLEMFSEEDALEELGHDCINCHLMTD